MARASFAWGVVAVIAAVVAVTSAQAVVDDITPSFAEVYPSASVKANGANLENVVYVTVAGRIAIVTDVVRAQPRMLGWAKAQQHESEC